MNGAERRQHVRVPLISEAWLTGPDGSGEHRHVRTEDLSVGGLCVTGHQIAPDARGEVVMVTLRLPGEDAPIRVRGQIAWWRGGRAGIQFHEMPDEEAGVISRVLRQVQAELDSFQDERTPRQGISRVMVDLLTLPNG